MGGGFRPSRSPPMTQSRLPATRPAAPPAPVQQAPMQNAPSRGPGLFGQMAATAGGVAIGSAVGHAVGHAMTGGGGQQVEAAPVQQYQDAPPQQQYQQGPVCEFEMKRFMECAQNQHDLSLCSAFNDALRQCKVANGLQ